MNNVHIFGEPDENTLDQFAEAMVDGEHGVLCADAHYGYHVPVGGVIAYRDKVSVAAVGFDISCGNAAVKTDVQYNPGTDYHALADEIFDSISFGVGRKNQHDDAPVDHSLFEYNAWEIIPPEHREKLRDKARAQLGTVGSGNHYVDVFVDEDNYLWVGVHFGSRGFGHTVATNFLALSQGKKWGERPEGNPAGLLEFGPNRSLAEEYEGMMQLCGIYAYAGRDWVADTVARILGSTQTLARVHNNHNFGWREVHFGEEFIVVRKGATPAFPGQQGFVGGSMGDNAVILEGSLESSETQKRALFSTVHGAGRVMSRTDATGRNRKGKQVREPRIVESEVWDWLDQKGVILRGGGLDEAPQAYRRLDDVLNFHGDTVKIIHTLRPLIVCMAPSDNFDPYKD